MSRPFKHPRTGVYYFRKAVPDDLRSVIGKREVKISLRTKNPSDAKTAHAKVAAEVEHRWKALRAAPEPLTQRQVVALAGVAYHELTGLLADEPGPTEAWDHVLRLHHQARESGRLEEWVGPTVDDVLQRQGIRADDASRARLLNEIDRAFVQAAQHLKRNAEGDYRPDPDAARFPEWVPPASTPASPALGIGNGRPGTTLAGLVEDWWREAKAAGAKPSTYESYSSTITKLVAFLGHDDAGRVTGPAVGPSAGRG